MLRKCHIPYFVKEHSDLKNKYTEEDIKKLQFLVDNIFVVFSGKVFQQKSAFPWAHTVPLS